MSVRQKLLAVSLLLCVALASVIFAAVSTVQAYQQFTQDHQRVVAKDVSTVGPWMTIPYIAHAYSVPESCLSQSLHITKPVLKYRASLRFIADYSRRPLDSVMRDVRTTIQVYRQHHLVCPTPTPAPAVQLLYASRYPPALYGREREL
ncbi:MAG: hypothetical protein ABI234_08695 [Ktedonobacteraceae bacterium]